MMDLTSVAGHSFGPHRFDVGRADIADFVDATRDDVDRWGDIAPPGFVSACLFAVAPDLLCQLTEHSVLHGEQTYTWRRPMIDGATLQVGGTVSRVRERGGVNFVSFDLEVEDEQGTVAEGSALFLVSGESTPISGNAERPEPAPLDDGHPGSGQVSASRADLIRYAAATRDWNPIHWDHRSAVEAGLPGVVAHGLLQASWAFVAASRLRSGDVPLSSARVRFRNPLPPATPVSVSVSEAEEVVDVAVAADEVEYLSARITLGER